MERNYYGFYYQIIKIKRFNDKIFYDSIMVVTDKLIKYFHFILFQKILTQNS